jgi:hypothetical protein
MSRTARAVPVLFALDGVQVGPRRATDAPAFHAYPDDLEWADPARLGPWLRAAIEADHPKAKAVTVVLQRREYTTKRLEFETVPDVAHDLPGMVRIQMEDQAAAARGAVSDFTTPTSPDAGGPVTTFAAALPSLRIDAIRQAAEAAGLKLASITTLALSALDAAAGDTADTLLVAQTPGGLEFVATDEAGTPTLYRWLNTSGNEHDPATIAEQFQRMLVMQQLDAAHLPSRVIAVANDPADAERFQGVIAETLSRPVEAPNGKPTSALALAARAPMLDFASPTAPPDRAAKRRQGVLAAALGLIVIAGAGYTLAKRAVDNQNRELDLIRTQLEDAEKTRTERVRLAAVQEHTSRWLASGVDPTAETARVVSRLPSHQELFLSELTLVSDPVVAYERQRRESRYDPSRWRSSSPIRVDVRGAGATQQAVYDAWQALLAPEDLRVEPLAADGATTSIERYPRKFEVRITADALEPAAPEEPETESSDAESPETETVEHPAAETGEGGGQ